METEVAVVTGGAGGLGQLITQRLAQRGFVVAIADIDRDAAAELTAELAGQGSRALFIETDASNADDIRRLMARVASLGVLKILINNSASCRVRSESPGSCLDDSGAEPGGKRFNFRLHVRTHRRRERRVLRQGVDDQGPGLAICLGIELAD
jgi:NAD(P)-dependent dehydrogenase (short-subunit alcohol dehydrogenase family)